MKQTEIIENEWYAQLAPNSRYRDARKVFVVKTNVTKERAIDFYNAEHAERFYFRSDYAPRSGVLIAREMHRYFDNSLPESQRDYWTPEIISPAHLRMTWKAWEKQKKENEQARDKQAEENQRIKEAREIKYDNFIVPIFEAAGIEGARNEWGTRYSYTHAESRVLSPHDLDKLCDYVKQLKQALQGWEQIRS